MKDLLVHILSPAKSQLFMTYAAYLAKDLGLSVKYLYVHAPGVYPLGMPGNLNASVTALGNNVQEGVEKARYHLELQISKLNASDPSLTLLDYKIEVGYVPEVIHEYCQDNRVDTIMIPGIRNTSFFSENSPGIEIIRNLPCPVWIVPEGITYKPFSEIIYATDYNQEDITSLKFLANFASKFLARITAVHISDDVGFGEKIKVAGFAEMIRKETGYDMISHKVLAGKPGESLVQELHDYALMVDADLIVLLRENRGFADRLFHGSRSVKIARETQLPVLIFNEVRK